MKKFIPCSFLSSLRLLFYSLCLAGSLPIASAQDAVIQLEQKINEALDAAGNDPVAIEAAVQNLMAETRPTAAGMKKIAEAAMRKVASFNKNELLSAVSEGVVRAAMSQAVASGVDPIKAAASVSEGLVVSASETASRRGGNSFATAALVAKSAVSAVVSAAGTHDLSASNAANAAAFGAMSAAMATSIDYGQDLVSMVTDLTSGITEGVVSGANKSGVNVDLTAQAGFTGTVDSIHIKASDANLQAGPLVEAARKGFIRGMKLATGRDVSPFADEEEPNRDILGMLSEPRTVFVKNEKGEFEVHLQVSSTLIPDPSSVTFTLFKNGVEIEQSSSSVFSRGTEINEDNVGIYLIQITDKNTGQVLSAIPSTFSLVVADQIPVSAAE